MRRPLALAAAAAAAAALLAACSTPSETAAFVAPAGSKATSAAPKPSAPPGSDAATASPSSKASPSASDMPLPVVEPDTAPASAKTMRGVFRVSTKKPVFFITVDDGYSKPKSALSYIASRHLPVTTFLTNAAVDGNYAYFKKFSAYDAVQNHTMTHQALSKASTNREFQICKAQSIYAAKYGQRPWILRPPYGAGFMPRRSTTPLIEATAASCGIKHIALWDVTISAHGKVEYASGSGIKRGDIVLLHFEGDVTSNLKLAVALGKRAGLTPAPLSSYLPK